MKLEEKNLIVKRAYKSVYKCDDCIVKVFNEGHPKSDVFNEALNTARGAVKDIVLFKADILYTPVIVYISWRFLIRCCGLCYELIAK